MRLARGPAVPLPLAQLTSKPALWWLVPWGTLPLWGATIHVTCVLALGYPQSRMKELSLGRGESSY